MPRGNGGTSGSLVLALSLGTPVIAADTPTYREITGDGAAAWLFEPGNQRLARRGDRRRCRLAGRAPRRKAAAAAEAAAALDWTESARLIATVLRSVG